MTAVAGILRRAALLVTDRGLAKGTLEDSAGRLDVWGALAVAAGGKPWNLSDPLVLDAEDAVQRLLAQRGHAARSLSDWNDDPATQAGTVVAVLYDAAHA